MHVKGNGRATGCKQHHTSNTLGGLASQHNLHTSGGGADTVLETAAAVLPLDFLARLLAVGLFFIPDFADCDFLSFFVFFSFLIFAFLATGAGDWPSPVAGGCRFWAVFEAVVPVDNEQAEANKHGTQ